RDQITLVVIDDVTMLLEAAEERRALTAIVSHELRNPLTAIVGHVDLLREREDLPGRVPAQLEVIANAGERMQELVTTMLDQAVPPTEDPFEPVDLRQIFDAAAASAAPLIAVNRQVLEIVGVDALIIHGDAFRLRQVLDNLLSNAV